MKPLPPGKKATGSVAAAFADDPFLYSHDLPDDRDTPVRVQEVLHWDRLEVAGVKYQNLFALRFVGKRKILPLNCKARFKAMVKVGGRNFESWEGKEISLFVAEVDAFGQTVDAIRIRTPGRGKGRARDAENWLDGDPGPAEPSGPEAGTAASKPPGDLISDDAAFREFSELAKVASDSFNGERLFIKEAPPKSGAWCVNDQALGDVGAKLYDAIDKKLMVTREQLAELTTKLQAIAA